MPAECMWQSEQEKSQGNRRRLKKKIHRTIWNLRAEQVAQKDIPNQREKTAEKENEQKWRKKVYEWDSNKMRYPETHTNILNGKKIQTLFYAIPLCALCRVLRIHIFLKNTYAFSLRFVFLYTLNLIANFAGASVLFFSLIFFWFLRINLSSLPPLMICIIRITLNIFQFLFDSFCPQQQPCINSHFATKVYADM